ncbi:ATP-dependent DNA helicase pfh1 [Purpureocillium lavendulum]|uniref:ATP-dependent DNA helicase pfh1 n=1 Tax=Purpureocillium lavendulum TaxID=1247861 RepID=A0AB34FCI3_9HYPO|nr:ATP-dependent DNA helicase pfh1 [Purpureocillium lavendulum]
MTTKRRAAALPAPVGGKRKGQNRISRSKRRRIDRPPPETEQAETPPECAGPTGEPIGKAVTDVPQKLQPWEVGEDLWRLIAKSLSEPIEINWPYKSNEDYEDVSNTLLQMEKVRWAWRDLNNLAQTCGFMYRVATKWLYRWVSLGNGQSATSFLNALYHCPERRLYVHHFAITGILDERPCHVVFQNYSWQRLTMENADRPVFLDDGISAIMRATKHSPAIASVILALILIGLRNLRSLHLNQPLFGDERARKIFNLILKDKQPKDSTLFPMLSELDLVMGATQDPFEYWTPSATGPEAGIKRLQLANATCFGRTKIRLCDTNMISVMEKVESLQLSFVHMENCCWQGLFRSTLKLRELHIRLACVRFSVDFDWVDHLNNALPSLANTLERLTIDSCYHLRIPSAFLFESPIHMRDAVILEVLPPTLISLEIQEVWAENHTPSDEFKQMQYSRCVATFLDDASARLRGMKLLRFFYQWEYCLSEVRSRRRLSASAILFDIVPLDSSSPDSLSKLVCAYLATGDHDRAKNAAWDAVRAGRLNRGAAVRLCQVYAIVGQLNDGINMLKELHPPVSQEICTPNTLLIETFQHARTRDFTKLLSILEENTAEEENTAVKRFDAPSGGYRVEANGDADVVLWVVDAANGASWVPSARELTTRLNIAAINPRDRLVVVIANLDSVSLSESAVSDAANCFRTIKLEAKYV